MSTAHGGRGGAIVNLSSVAARLGGAGRICRLRGLEGRDRYFTIGLAREVAAEGIRVNAVRPGLIITDIHASGGDPDRAERLGRPFRCGRAARRRRWRKRSVWLISDAASYVTGTILEVTGGR